MTGRLGSTVKRSMPAMLLAGACAGLVAPAPAAAQVAGDSLGGHRFEQQTRERWMHGRQRAAFTPFDDGRRWAQIDSVRPGAAPGERVLFLLVDGSLGRSPAQLITDARGSVVRVTVALPPLRSRPSMPGEPSVARQTRWALLSGPRRDQVSLPEARLWDLVPTFDAPRPAAGVRWVDTLSMSAVLDGDRQALHGVRISTIVGDTSVAGHRLWIVRDSARVRYEERAVIEERTLDTLAVVEHRGEGSVLGRHLYDPELRLFRVRHDTTMLVGEAVLRYADGRAFRTPARYERTRRTDLHDAASYATRQQALQAARGELSIVKRPEGLSERLAAGDTAARDSLLSLWARSRDPGQRRLVRGLLSPFAREGPASDARLRATALALGDTAGVVAELRGDWMRSGRSIDMAQLALMLPFMDDPGMAFAFGLDRDQFYEEARQGLLTHPPAVTADRARWPCTPDACRALAAQFSRARESRLSELALIAHVTLDPAHWSNVTLSYAAASGSTSLRDAALLVRGVGATWPAASKAPLPPPDADWHAWSEWMNGVDPAYRNYGSSDPVRFEERHAVAIRFYQARAGRDVVAELRRKLGAATSDTARLVFGTMLLGLGEPPRAPAEIAAAFRSGSSAARALAVRELGGLLTRTGPSADSATVQELMGRMLDVALDTATPWPELTPPPAGRGGWGSYRLASATAPIPIVIRGDNLPRALRERWTTRGARIVDVAWHAPSDQSFLVITPSDVRQAGPFVRLGMDYAHLATRIGGRGTSYAGGWTIYLMQTDAGWVVVASSAWIT